MADVVKNLHPFHKSIYDFVLVEVDGLKLACPYCHRAVEGRRERWACLFCRSNHLGPEGPTAGPDFRIFANEECDHTKVPPFIRQAILDADSNSPWSEREELRTVIGIRIDAGGIFTKEQRDLKLAVDEALANSTVYPEVSRDRAFNLQRIRAVYTDIFMGHGRLTPPRDEQCEALARRILWFIDKEIENSEPAIAAEDERR